MSRVFNALTGTLIGVTAIAGGCKAHGPSTASDDAAQRPPREAPAVSPAADSGASDAAPAGDSATAAHDVEYYPAATLTHLGDSLSRTPRTGHVLRNHPSFQTIELRRAAGGVPELHDRWTDVMLFQAGRAGVLLGGAVRGAVITAPGEHRGGVIAGGHVQHVAAGDMLIIPAGIPHQIQIARGDSLRYITVKVPR
jgi:hypothetical protein